MEFSMVTSYLDYMVEELLPDLWLLLDSLIIADGVSVLGLMVAVTLLCLFIGSILMRVS